MVWEGVGGGGRGKLPMISLIKKGKRVDDPKLVAFLQICSHPPPSLLAVFPPLSCCPRSGARPFGGLLRVPRGRIGFPVPPARAKKKKPQYMQKKEAGWRIVARGEDTDQVALFCPLSCPLCFFTRYKHHAVQFGSP